MSIYNILYFILMFFASVVITKIVIKLASSSGLIDTPNTRSSHSVPKPRGGGISFFALGLLTLAVCVVFSILDLVTSLALVLPGAILGITGFLDDRLRLPSSIRFIVQIIAIGAFLLLLAPSRGIHIGSIELGGSFLILPILAVAMLWTINMYNFMDGSDGLAGMQAIVVFSVGGAVSVLSGDFALSFICFALVAAIAGFMVFNFPPASVFMGDVGSYFLGFMILAVGIVANERGSVPLLVWLFLPLVFYVDSTATLTMRIAGGEKWFQPHRKHAYQRLIQMGNSHLVTLLVYSVANIAIVAGPVLVSLKWPEAGPATMGTATFLLLALWATVQVQYRRRNPE